MSLPGVYQLWIPGPMPGMNEIIDAKATSKKTKGGKRWDAYQGMKKSWSEKIAIYVRAAHFPLLVGPHEFFFEHRELHRQRDPDNFSSGAAKLTFDALQEAGIMENDGWKQVVSIQHMWKVDAERPGVLLTARASGDL